MILARALISGFGLAVVLGSAGCTVRGHGSVGVRPAAVVVYDAPPPRRVETVTVRPGFVWISGRWVQNNGQWVWMDGRWERERTGYAWSDGQWERRGNQWIWVEGRWTVSSQPIPQPMPQPAVDSAPGGVVVAPPPPSSPVVENAAGGSQWPTSPPPAVRVERPGARAGFMWITGRWDWRNGQWAWVDGHWERERANHRWVAGGWQRQGRRWVWIDGRWEAHVRVKSRGPIVRDHR